MYVVRVTLYANRKATRVRRLTNVGARRSAIATLRKLRAPPAWPALGAAARRNRSDAKFRHHGLLPQPPLRRMSAGRAEALASRVAEARWREKRSLINDERTATRVLVAKNRLAFFIHTALPVAGTPGTRYSVLGIPTPRSTLAPRPSPQRRNDGQAALTHRPRLAAPLASSAVPKQRPKYLSPSALCTLLLTSAAAAAAATALQTAKEGEGSREGGENSLIRGVVVAV